MAIETKTWKVAPDQTGRIDRIVQKMTDLSRSRVQALFDHGCVQLNQQPCGNVAQRVAAGDVVALQYDPGQGYRPQKKPWTDRTFSVVFEDDHLLVANKSAKVLTIEQDDRPDRNTLLERVGLYLKAQSRRTPHLVHRLERGMSGLIVFAKTLPAAQHLQSQFLTHQPRRRFTVVVAGTGLPDQGSFQSYVATGENLEQYSTEDKSIGELSTTHYQVLQVLGGATLLTVRPEVGQPNHIRLHLAEQGYPVLGDRRYIDKFSRRLRRTQREERLEIWKHPGWRKSFLAMHASHLSLIHPATGKTVGWEATIPKAMSAFVRGHR